MSGVMLTRLRRLHGSLQGRPWFVWGLRGAQALLGLGMLWWLIGAGGLDVGDLGRRIQHADLALLALGALCFALSTAAVALRYTLFLPATVSFRYTMAVSLLQQALVTFVPWRLGEASYPLLLRRDHAVPLGQGAAMLVAVRLADLAVILGFAAVALLRLGLDVGLVAAVGLAGAGGAAALVLVAWRLAPARLAGLRRVLGEAYGPLRRVRRQVAFVALSIAYFALSIAQSSLILSALGMVVAPADIAALQALSLLFALLPIHPPGGWGTADTMQVFVLERLGYSPSLAIPVILVAHSVYTVLFALGGCAGWLLRAHERRAAASAIARLTK